MIKALQSLVSGKEVVRRKKGKGKEKRHEERLKEVTMLARGLASQGGLGWPLGREGSSSHL